MYRNPFWLIFLGLIVLVSMGYTARTAFHLWQYLRLDRQVPAENIQWSVVPLSDEEFVPLARYRFKARGKNYEGQTLWQESYLNASTAQEAIDRLSSIPPLIWYDASAPETSSFQKIFPVKESIYTILLWMLGIYFLGLGYYVKQRFPH